jgi:hypothetical protein
MGKLLAFKLPKKSKRAHHLDELGAVILFTGVRREFMTDVLKPRGDIEKPSCAKRGKSNAAARSLASD